MEAIIRKYEMMMILRPDLLEKDVEKVLAGVREYIKEAEGTITLEDIWGKRTLAYPIKKQEKGLYVVFYFDLPGKNLKALDQDMRLDNEVLRHMIVKTPDDLDVIEYITILKEQSKKDQDNLEKEREEKLKQEPKKPSKPAPRKSSERKSSDDVSAPVKRKNDKEIDAHVDQLLDDLDDE